MDAAKFQVLKTFKNGAPAFEVVVRNSRSNMALHAECVRLGLEPTVSISNRRAIIVTNDDDFQRIRDALRPFFTA